MRKNTRQLLDNMMAFPLRHTMALHVGFKYFLKAILKTEKKVEASHIPSVATHAQSPPLSTSLKWDSFY